MSKGIMLRTGSGVPSNLTATPDKVLYGSSFVGTARTKETGTIQKRGASTITPTKNGITIPAGVYLTGTQIIKGDSNLVPGNIKAGVSIFGVTGTY